MAVPKKPKDAKEKIARLQSAFDDFLRELSSLKKERSDIVQKYVSRIERQKIEELRKQLGAGG